MGVSSRGHFGRPDFARFLALLLVVAALAGTIGGFAVIEYFMNKMGWLNGGFIADYFTQLGAVLGNRGFDDLRIANRGGGNDLRRFDLARN
jgi:hypothetical protein